LPFNALQFQTYAGKTGKKMLLFLWFPVTISGPSFLFYHRENKLRQGTQEEALVVLFIPNRATFFPLPPGQQMRQGMQEEALVVLFIPNRATSLFFAPRKTDATRHAGRSAGCALYSEQGHLSFLCPQENELQQGTQEVAPCFLFYLFEQGRLS
jgi:hypothetical protein